MRRKDGLIVRSGIAVLWDRWKSSIWFLPSLLTLGAFLVARASLSLDLDPPALFEKHPWLVFQGEAPAARQILGAIASTTITVVAVIFSITIVAIQQASSQYSPRILHRFTRDRGNQLVLGSYIATFTFAMLVLERVRSPESGGAHFVPAFSTRLALVFVLINVALLIYFIHHISLMLHSSSLLATIRCDLDQEAERLYSRSEPGAHCGETPETMKSGYRTQVRARTEGFIRAYEVSEIAEALATCEASRVEIERPVGDYLVQGSVFLTVWSKKEPGQKCLERVRGSVTLSENRSIYQDPAFGIRQIVDVALKALSPGINDPTTAEEALLSLKGFFARLVGRDVAVRPARLESGGEIVIRTADYGDLARLAFEQIRLAAKGHPHVLRLLRSALEELIELEVSPRRKAHLGDQLRLVQDSIGGSSPSRTVRSSRVPARDQTRPSATASAPEA